MNSAALYTPRVLQLATSLAEFGWDESLPLQGGARSRSCGSAISLGLSINSEGRIETVGLRSQACAIGQASAAIFAGSASGLSGAEMRTAYAEIGAWLAGNGPIPDWPGLDAIAPAREFPGRHGAIVLAWQAASEILPMP